MKDEDRQRVASVIEANSKPVTLEQLAQRGEQRKFRVISMTETLQLIEAVVDGVIAQGTSGIANDDRQRIVDEANEQFQQVSRIHAESKAKITEQEGVIESQQAQIQQLQQQADEHLAQLDQSQQTTQALADAQEQLDASRQRQQKAVRAIKQLDRRLSNARETIINYDREFDRLVAQVKEDSSMIDQLRQQIQDRDQELGRVKGLMEGLHQEVSASRGRGDDSPQGVEELRSELVDVKAFLKSIQEQNENGHGVSVDEMLDKLTQKQASAKSELEDRFNSKLDETLNKIGHAIQVANARPIDRAVDATGVYLSKIFDEEDSMESNFNNLDVQATTTKQSISNSLDRLKQLRNQASKVMEESPQADQEDDAKEKT